MKKIIVLVIFMIICSSITSVASNFKSDKELNTKYNLQIPGILFTKELSIDECKKIAHIITLEIIKYTIPEFLNNSGLELVFCQPKESDKNENTNH
jgi:hypothetical protein